MASLTLPYPNLTNGQNADALQVNANYAAVVTFLLTLIPHTDGTNAFTGLPVLPASAPGTTNAVRKDVMDAALALRVKNVRGAEIFMAAGSATGVVLDGAGNSTVIMGMTLPNAPYCVMVSPTSATAALVKATTTRSTTQFQILGTPSATVSFDWIALSL